MRFPNRAVLDDALRQCRGALIMVTRERLTSAFADRTVERLQRALPKLEMKLRGAAQTASAGVVRHEFADEFELLDFAEVGRLLTAFPTELLGSKVPPVVSILLDELAESRNANSHSPPSDISFQDLEFGLVRVARVLRAFGLPTEAIDCLSRPLVDVRESSASGIWEWSEFGRALRGREIDLLDERVWPRHETSLLANGERLCPYVKRDAHADLLVRLKVADAENARSWHDRIVAVVGESKSGKTGLLVECLAELTLNGRGVLWLRQPTAAERSPLAQVVAALRQRPELRSTLAVVIDDFQFHVGAQRESIGYHDVRFLAEGGAIVAVTAHPHVLKGLGSERPTTDDPAGRPTAEAALDQRLREVLEGRRLDLAPAFSLEEAARAEVTGLQAEEIARLPETLAAANLVTDKLDAADPQQRAAIASARLLSIAAPNGIQAEPLANLTSIWRERELGRASTREQIQAAIDWASRPMVGDVALLQPVGGQDARRYRLLDQLREPVEFPYWLPQVTNTFAFPDLVAIAVAWAREGGDPVSVDLMLADAEPVAEDPSEVAYLRWAVSQDVELGAAHLRRAAASGHPDAMFDLAVDLAADDARLDEVRYWFESAAAAGAEDALVALAGVMLERGLTADAVALLEAEAKRGTTLAYMPLAQQLERAGDRNGALRWFALARETGDPAFADLYEQGKLAVQLGDAETAGTLFQQGMERGDAWCAYELAAAEMSRSLGLNDRARHLLEVASKGGHPFAAVRLADAELTRSWTSEGVAALLSALSEAEESDDLEDYLASTQPSHRVRQAYTRGDNALATRLIAMFADRGAEFDGSDIPEPLLYDTYVQTGEEDLLYAAADAGDSRARSELSALDPEHGAYEDDGDGDGEDDSDNHVETEDEDWDGERGVWRSDDGDEDGERDPHW